MNSIIKTLALLLCFVQLLNGIALLTGCDDNNNNGGSSNHSNNSYSGSYNGSSSSQTDGYFTNKYGTRTTKCAHTGCNNYIASSGDTNCCVTHSNKCGECRCYIDEDAMFCLDCLSGYFN